MYYLTGVQLSSTCCQALKKGEAAYQRARRVLRPLRSHFDSKAFGLGLSPKAQNIGNRVDLYVYFAQGEAEWTSSTNS